MPDVHEKKHHEGRFECGDDERGHSVETAEIEERNLHGEIRAEDQDAEDRRVTRVLRRSAQGAWRPIR